jgi:hypothetical protein
MGQGNPLKTFDTGRLGTGSIEILSSEVERVLWELTRLPSGWRINRKEQHAITDDEAGRRASEGGSMLDDYLLLAANWSLEERILGHHHSLHAS